MSSSSSSSVPGQPKSSKQGAKTGENWTYKIYFDPQADDQTGTGYYIEDDQLIDKMSKLVDAKENIITVSMYKAPLSWYQLTKAVLFHGFVVFVWSIEKHSDGITIQRSKHRNAVRDKYRQTARFEGLSGISLMKSAPGRKTVHDLIDWLYRTNELNREYHYVHSNCQHFAENVYNFVT